VVIVWELRGEFLGHFCGKEAILINDVVALFSGRKKRGEKRRTEKYVVRTFKGHRANPAVFAKPEEWPNGDEVRTPHTARNSISYEKKEKKGNFATKAWMKEGMFGLGKEHHCLMDRRGREHKDNPQVMASGGRCCNKTKTLEGHIMVGGNAIGRKRATLIPQWYLKTSLENRRLTRI